MVCGGKEVAAGPRAQVADMTTEEPYTIAQPGTPLWHIPDAHGRPLCGAVILGQPVRRYLPCGLKPDDVCCERCRALKGQGKP